MVISGSFFHFKNSGPFNAVQSSTIHLTNPSDDKVTFKVKTTVPKRYCVRPSCGIVEPSQSVDVTGMCVLLFS